MVFESSRSTCPLELGTALRMGVAIGSREGCVEAPGSMVEINDLFSVR